MTTPSPPIPEQDAAARVEAKIDIILFKLTTIGHNLADARTDIRADNRAVREIQWITAIGLVVLVIAFVAGLCWSPKS